MHKMKGTKYFVKITQKVEKYLEVSERKTRVHLLAFLLARYLNQTTAFISHGIVVCSYFSLKLLLTFLLIQTRYQDSIQIMGRRQIFMCSITCYNSQQTELFLLKLKVKYQVFYSRNGQQNFESDLSTNQQKRPRFTLFWKFFSLNPLHNLARNLLQTCMHYSTTNKLSLFCWCFLQYLTERQFSFRYFGSISRCQIWASGTAMTKQAKF